MDQARYQVLEPAERTISPQGRAAGAVAEAVELGTDAPVLDRLIAFTGRTPA